MSVRAGLVGAAVWGGAAAGALGAANDSDWDLARRVGANHEALRTGHGRARLKEIETLATVAGAQDEYNVLHYTIDIDVDPGIFSRDIDGSCDILLTPTGAELYQVVLDLDWRMKVSAVFDGEGLPLSYGHHLDVLTVELAPTLMPGEEATIRVEYGGSPLTNFFGFDIWRLRPTPVVYTLCEPNGSRTWWPCKDHPSDKATVDLIITMPQRYTVASNGLLEAVMSNDEGTLSHHWSTRYPLAPYLVAFTATNFVLIEDSYELSEGGTLPLLYYTWPEDVEDAEQDVASIPGMLSVFEDEWFGYPFPEEKYGHMETPLVTGAMEHTTMTSYGQLLYTGTGYFDYVAAHELAHHWWGDLVTCGTWDDIWLNEGFATYAEAIYHEALTGFGGYLEYMRAIERPRFYGPIHAPNRVLNTTVYDKGAWVLHMLRGIVGRDILMGILRTWGTRFAHESPVTSDFTAVAAEVAGQDLDWFFDPWLYEIGRPEYEYGLRVRPIMEDRSWIDLQLEQVQGGVNPYTMPITLRAHLEGGEHVDVVVENGATKEAFSFLIDGVVEEVEIDPESFVLAEFREREWVPNLRVDVSRR